MTTEYEFHPIAGLFPLIEGEQYEKFKTDIAEHGQREPGVIYEGRVLEGRMAIGRRKTLAASLSVMSFRPKSTLCLRH